MRMQMRTANTTSMTIIQAIKIIILRIRLMMAMAVALALALRW